METKIIKINCQLASIDSKFWSNWKSWS